MKMSNLQIVGIIAVALVLSTVIIVAMPVTAAAVSVIRALPDDPVYPEDEIEVSLNQSGFFADAGTVTETLPEGFTYWGLESGGKLREYDEATNKLKIDFCAETTLTYRVKAGTAEQIETAVFSGTWISFDVTQGKSISGDIEGDDTLTLGVGPKPTPTPTPTPGNGGGNGGGDDGIPPTPPAGTQPYIALGANPADIPADGSSTSVITASVWDGEDWVLENLTVNFSTSRGSINASALIENGTATVILTAGMEEGAATITAEANLPEVGVITNTTVNFTTPGATPTPPVLTPTPTVTVSPTSTATPTATPSPTKEPLIPGFEAVFVIASLLSVAYQVLRRRKKKV